VCSSPVRLGLNGISIASLGCWFADQLGGEVWLIAKAAACASGRLWRLRGRYGALCGRDGLFL